MGSPGAKAVLCTQQYIIQIPAENGQKDRGVKLGDEPGHGDEPGACKEGVTVNSQMKQPEQRGAAGNLPCLYSLNVQERLEIVN